MADSLIPDDQSENERQAIINKWKEKPQAELLEAKAESDLYIKTLTARFDDLSKDYLAIKERQEASAQLKDLIDQMKSGINNDTVRTHQDTVNQPAIKPEEIESLVEAKLAAKFTQHQATLRQQENLSGIQTELKKQWGDNYLPAYKQRLDQLGLTPEFADDLARNHPTVFLKTFELDARPMNNNTNLPRNTQRPSTFAPATQKKDWNYYQELKKTNPKLYLDPKIANEMHDQAIALGPDFGMPLD